MNKHEESGEVKEIVNPRKILDAILTTELGQIGKYQLLNGVLCFLVVITVGCSANEYVFTTAKISTRCAIPECDSENPEFSPQWLVNAVPSAGDSFDNCLRFSSSNTTSDNEGICPAELFDPSILVKCDQYVYENDETIVYDFDLGCNDWLRTLVGSFRKLACVLALPITGYISDRWGRRAAIVFNAINCACFGIIRYWANSYVTYVISEFVESMLGSALLSSIHILVMELVGPRYRVVMGVATKSGYSLGQVTLSLLAWAVPTWRQLTLAIYIPQLVSVTYFWIFTESVLWYMSNGHFKKSEKILKKIARVNGKQLSQASLDALRKAGEQEMSTKDMRNEQVNEPWLLLQVFRHKKVFIMCLVSPVWWITSSLVYTGMTINAVGLSGNKYVNYAAVAAAQVPGMCVAAVLLDRLGRKPVFIASFWMCGICQLAYVFIPIDMYAASLSVYLAGNFFISIVMTTVYVYTAELFPTKYRHRLFAFSSMVGRIGSIVAPLTPALAAEVWDKLPFVLFGSLSLVSGLLVFLTPETLGIKLPNTMEEAERMGDKTYVCKR